ncbi:hypothetical protein PSTT_15581 [Puccinia striiformis]|uniref:Uncharacterized protein n=1 Tax=Puccinia striiformis TaxID=27350 RepID=A0A2S4UH54_9BASI|nr:hypothetical protein PSTT_15581 [Puccinia striiformis]
MEYCPTASVQPPWQNRFDEPAYRKEAGKDLLELATQKEPREMDYPTTKMADSPDSKQSPKQQDRDRGGRYLHVSMALLAGL